MSIILDALKKAESERHVGQLPGLHTPRPTTSELPAVSKGMHTRVVWCAISIVLVLVAIAVWWFTNTGRTSVTSEAHGMAPSSSAQSVLPIQPIQLPAAQPTPTQQPAIIAAPAREIPVPPPLPAPLPAHLPAPGAKPIATVPAKPTPSPTVAHD